MGNANIGGGIVPGLRCVPHPRSPPESRVLLNPSSLFSELIRTRDQRAGEASTGGCFQQLSRTPFSNGRAGPHQDRTATFCTTHADEMPINGICVVSFEAGEQVSHSPPPPPWLQQHLLPSSSSKEFTYPGQEHRWRPEAVL